MKTLIDTPSPSGIRAALAAAILLLVLAGCNRAEPTYALDPPAAIGPLARVWQLQGPQADDLIRRVHPHGGTPERSWVAAYGPDDRIVIYASRFSTPALAQAASDQTRQAATTSGFESLQPMTISQESGFGVSGGGQDHFFYTRGAWLIWIQGMSRDFEPATGSLDWRTD